LIDLLKAKVIDPEVGLGGQVGFDAKSHEADVDSRRRGDLELVSSDFPGLGRSEDRRRWGSLDGLSPLIKAQPGNAPRRFFRV
jgi:hypothetical protein